MSKMEDIGTKVNLLIEKTTWSIVLNVANAQPYAQCLKFMADTPMKVFQGASLKAFY